MPSSKLRRAPSFSLLDQDGIEKTLDDYAGKWLVLYFYPKDNTPACTKQACSFRDEREIIEEQTGAVVVGVSRDTPRSHKKFADKHGLNFTLLSDPDHVAHEAYGAWGPKKFMGREFLGALRNTYIINPDGRIVTEYLGVSPAQNAAEILDDLTKLQKQSS